MSESRQGQHLAIANPDELIVKYMGVRYVSCVLSKTGETKRRLEMNMEKLFITRSYRGLCIGM